MDYIKILKKLRKVEDDLLDQVSYYYDEMWTRPNNLSAEYRHLLDKWSRLKSLEDKVYLRARKQNPAHPSVLEYAPFFDI